VDPKESPSRRHRAAQARQAVGDEDQRAEAPGQGPSRHLPTLRCACRCSATASLDDVEARRASPVPPMRLSQLWRRKFILALMMPPVLIFRMTRQQPAM
jgi:hypothetical protein